MLRRKPYFRCHCPLAYRIRHFALAVESEHVTTGLLNHCNVQSLGQ